MTESAGEYPNRITVTRDGGQKITFAAASYDTLDGGSIDIRNIDDESVIATFAPGRWDFVEADGHRAEPDADRYRRAYQAAARGLDLVRAALRADDPDLADALAEADKASETAWCIAEDEL